MPRIACLYLPLFPLAARLRSEPELTREALAVMEGNGNAARVVAATRLARSAGLRPGLTLPQARALCPKLVARPRDADCERAAQEALLEVAEGFSPRVEDAGDGVAYLDADGLERHYPGPSPELEMGRALMNAAEAAGLPARVEIPARIVAYHPPCSIQHGQKLTTGPQNLLRAAGFTVKLPADSHLCCGSAGTYNIFQPEIAGQLGARKAQTLEALRPDVVATGNIGCAVQIGQHSGLPVAHMVELLDWRSGSCIAPLSKRLSETPLWRPPSSDLLRAGAHVP